MVTVFGAVPFKLGTSSTTINPVISRAATSAAESANEILWIIQVDCQ